MTSKLPVPDLTQLESAPTHSASGWLRRAAAVGLPPIGVFILMIGLWYAASYVLLSPGRRFLLPPPDQVIKVAYLDPHNLSELLAALALSGQVALAGLAIATVIGVLFAVLMSRARWLERSLFPYAVILQTVPVLALVPLIGYLFGFKYTSRLVVCVMIALFPIIANTLFGLRSVDPALHDLFTLHRAGRWRRLVKLEIPAALPAFFTGLRISAGLSVIGAVVGDFFFQQGQPGIGQLIYQYPRRLESEKLYGAAILACLLGLVVFLVFGFIARRITSWHASVRDRPAVTSR